MYSAYLFLAALVCSTTLAKHHYQNCGAGPGYQHRPKRMANGREAIPNSWPFMVHLQVETGSKDDLSICGGTLLDKHHILTAAHCLFPTTKNTDITAFLGMHNTSALVGFVEKTISDFHQFHVGFNHETKIDDIAILRMETPVEFSDTISPICLPEGDDIKKDFADVDVTVIGWGLSNEETGKYPDNLQQGKLKTSTNHECKKKFNANEKLELKHEMLCGVWKDSTVGGPRLLNGDSGGPMLYQHHKDSPWVQIGVMSFTRDMFRKRDKALIDHFIVTTRLTKYLDWIKKSIEKLEKKHRNRA